MILSNKEHSFCSLKSVFYHKGLFVLSIRIEPVQKSGGDKYLYTYMSTLWMLLSSVLLVNQFIIKPIFNSILLSGCVFKAVDFEIWEFVIFAFIFI